MPDFPSSARRSVTTLALIVASIAAGSALAQTSSLNDFAGRIADLPGGTTIYAAREFITMDPKQPRAEFIAVRDDKGYRERLKKALASHKDKTVPFVTWGYHHYFHGEMSRDKLNKLAPDLPVIVWHRSARELFLNDAALKLTGIDESVVKSLPKSAQEQLSLAKGHFYEQGAMAPAALVASL
jgi:hypothetical protein